MMSIEKMASKRALHSIPLPSSAAYRIRITKCAGEPLFDADCRCCRRYASIVAERFRLGAGRRKLQRVAAV
jgi:hypothetical protein